MNKIIQWLKRTTSPAMKLGGRLHKVELGPLYNVIYNPAYKIDYNSVYKKRAHYLISCIAVIFLFFVVPVRADSADDMKPIFSLGISAVLSGPQYAFDVYPDHSVVFKGFREVRTVGTKKYSLTDEQYEGLLRLLNSYDFSALTGHRIPQELDTDLAVLIYHRHGKEMTLNLSRWDDSSILLKRRIEKELQITSIICPYTVDVSDGSRDICEVEKKNEQLILDNKGNK